MIKMDKSEKGITLVALVITIIILLIIASISVYEGKRLIADAKIDTLEANMLAIEAKAKGYVEEIDAQTWNLEEDKKQTERNEKFSQYYMTEVTVDSEVDEHLDSQINSYYAYKVTPEALVEMGLTDLAEEGDEYIVVYDTSDCKKMDVIYTKGFSYDNTKYYTLSELKKVIGEVES